MNFELKPLTLAACVGQKADALLMLVPLAFEPRDDALSAIVAAARKSEDLESKPGSSVQVFQPLGVAAPRLVVVACEDGNARQMRQAMTAVAGPLKARTWSRVLVCFAVEPDGAALRAVVQALADLSYVYTTTRSRKEGRALAQITLAATNAKALQPDFAHAVALVQGMELAREWGNRPANHATPTMLAEAAMELAKPKAARLRCEVLGPRQVARLGMGSFMAVAQGSEQELRFIVLRYNGAGASQAPTVLVGKGISFDTGGISIKPAAEMDEMKFDMCGAASVLGVFKALSVLKPAINVVGLIPSCENMPDGRSIKPGDVVTAMGGQTIEILNTDAEGRLILCDALTYAERFKPGAVIDVATLTGACVVALGGVRSGMFASSDELAGALYDAGEAALDPCWRLPLDDEYAEGLKTNFADVANVAGRAGGAITAAKFLQRFTTKYPWAHLDIAGSAWKSGSAKGSTARPVPLLLAYLVAQQAKPAAVKRASGTARKRTAA